MAAKKKRPRRSLRWPLTQPRSSCGREATRCVFRTVSPSPPFLVQNGALTASPLCPQGRVASFYGADMQPYVSYIMQPAADGEVRQILVNEVGVVSLGPKGLHMALRRGLPLWNCRCVMQPALSLLSLSLGPFPSCTLYI